MSLAAGLWTNPAGGTTTATHFLGHYATLALACAALEASGGFKTASSPGASMEALGGKLISLSADLTVAEPTLVDLDGTDPWSWSLGTGLTLDSDGIAALDDCGTWYGGDIYLSFRSIPNVGTPADGDYLFAALESQAQSGHAYGGGIARASGTWRSAACHGIPGTTFAPFSVSQVMTPNNPTLLRHNALKANNAGTDLAATLGGGVSDTSSSSHFGGTTGAIQRLADATDCRLIVAGKGGGGHVIDFLLVKTSPRIAP